MAQKLKDHNDIKIFILYLLKNVKRPLSFNELNDVVLQDDLVSYMDFAECLSELVDNGSISVGEGGEGGPYEITEKGTMIADGLQSSIAGYIRTKSLQSALRYLSFKERGIRTPVTSIPRADGGYDMIFTLTEKNEALFEVRVIADNAYIEQQMRHTFQEDPERIYRSILALLTADPGFLLK